MTLSQHVVSYSHQKEEARVVLHPQKHGEILQRLVRRALNVDDEAVLGLSEDFLQQGSALQQAGDAAEAQVGGREEGGGLMLCARRPVVARVDDLIA